MKIGISEQSQLLQVEWTNKIILDKTLEHGSKKVKAPCSRFLHSCCLLGQNLCLFGGKYKYAPLKDLWKLNIVTWEWTQIETTETVLPHLQGHTMVSYKSQIFIFGGTFYETSEETPLWIYNPDLNLLKKYTCEEQLPRPVGRREHTAVTHQNVMYIYGGFLDSCGSSEEFWAFDMEAEDWKQISKTKPGPHHGHVAVTHSGCMWIHGGMKNLTYLADIWMYDFALNTWKKVKGFGGTRPSLSGHSANVIYDDMILVGGHYNGQLSRDAWIFNFNFHTWRCVETPKEILLPPLSLHTSVIIDPTKISPNDPEASAKSVPNLKTKILPWHEQAFDLRPWTSPAPGSQFDPGPRPPLEGQFTLLPDKNNNSEEDITGLDREDLVFKTSGPRDCDMTHGLKQVQENFKFGSDVTEERKIFESKSNILKIHPSSNEDRYDEIPLLERFNSIGSDVDLGEHNAVISLSDEKLTMKSTKEDHQYFISPCDSLVTKTYTMNNSSTGYSASETSAEEFTSLFSSHYSSSIRLSTSHENGDVTSNYSSHTLSGKDKENFFINPLYEQLYLSNPYLVSSGGVRSEEDFMNASKSALKYGEKSLSSDLIVEDLEICDDDLILRNVRLASPGKPWSSLKDLRLFSKSLENDCDADTYSCALRQQNRTKSLSYFKDDDNKFLNFKEGHEIKRCTNEKQMTKQSGIHSVDAVKKQSRNSKGISKAYVKNSNMANRRNYVSHLTTQRQKYLNVGVKQDAYLCSQSSQLLLASEFKQSKPIGNHVDCFNHFIVQTKEVPYAVIESYREEKEKVSFKKPSSEVQSDQKLILVILGGQTEWQGFYQENLKMWNCYLL